MDLKCNHCKHKWKYKGKEIYYATCPKCLYKVNLKKEGKNGRK